MNAAVAAPHIPERLNLDTNFGFFVGAYLSSGCCTTHHVLITNMHDEFNEKIDQFCRLIDVKFHICHKKDVRRTTTLRMHSLVLAKFFTTSFGVKDKKRIPAEFFGAPTEFLKSLIDGFMSGKAKINTKLRYIGFTSLAGGLLEDLQQILTRFSITSTVVYSDDVYHFMIHPDQISKFQSVFNLTVIAKDDLLSSIQSRLQFTRLNTIPSINLTDEELHNVHRTEITKLQKQATSWENLQILQQIMDEDIIYDPIVQIERIKNPKRWVYDFTVEGNIS